MKTNVWQITSLSLVILLLQVLFLPVFSQHPFSKDDYESMAAIASQQGKNKEALDYMNKAIAKNPDRAELYLNRSSTYINLNDSKRALADLDKASALMKGRKSNPMAESLFYFNKGNVYLELKRDQDAFKNMQLAVEAFPDNAGAQLELGKLYGKFGKKELALKTLKAAREMYVTRGFKGKSIAVIDDEIAKVNRTKAR